MPKASGSSTCLFSKIENAMPIPWASSKIANGKWSKDWSMRTVPAGCLVPSGHVAAQTRRTCLRRHSADSLERTASHHEAAPVANHRVQRVATWLQRAEEETLLIL